MPADIIERSLSANGALFSPQRRIPGLLAGDKKGVGIEVDEYRGTLNVEVFYASCGVTVERLFEFENCGEGKCQHWTPPDPAQLERIRAEAKARHFAPDKTD